MRRLVALLIFASFLAGCASSPPPADPLPRTDQPTVPGPRFAEGAQAPLTLNYTDCSEQIGVLPIPMELATGEMPPGFAPAPFDDAGTMAAVAVVAYACQVEGEMVQEFNVGLTVLAPAGYAAPDARLHLLVGRSVTTRADSVALYEAWGASGLMVQGEVSVGLAAPATPGLRVGQATANDSGFGVTMASSVPVPGGAPETAGFARLIYTDLEMEVTGMVDFHWTSSMSGSNTGAATITVDDMPALPIAEAGSGVAFHYWGGYDYTATYVPLPA